MITIADILKVLMILICFAGGIYGGYHLGQMVVAQLPLHIEIEIEESE